ncbi:alpha-beta hydrolase superfamily lysophospholipase [Dysgonomonas sp. PFB1-18]|uniref:alpha/beta hydrolase n=1 Tax=unclassified Dysgonomonas TaxID=2630389 RepID=UPI00247689AB|nr:MULTISPECIES: alpha/beta hydrolase [unclassified Dysgonomonas]MDH6310218.1 alpha-beta hydrolase superfamily lysophospholipase [Dysgonomonas sp. PF1-14]MDH6340037.1 alpha-beta hydrolase superfamily lysophospholipase [Dysgonomonas sp. PF1-16]MDH6381856.1 alpha-beta hydrolase superfamily lysophospholipase [Dysgonomonas sp. PFB1-18]MDH6398902.1 alpha-beta hydrolase superfamily lysophospholipase [Dysgonomonas sp. PF1-23]
MTASLLYTEDILRNGFEELTIPLNDDYEGENVATLIRKKAEAGVAKAVLYIHGFNDYFFQAEMAGRFVDQGYNFYALDLRKYGRSYLPHQKFNDIRDLKAYYEEMRKALDIIHDEGNSEVILVGHSTGGLIVTLFAKDHPESDRYDGLILNSPFFDFNLSRHIKIFLPFVSFLGRFFPRVRVSGGFSEEYGKSIHQSYYGEWNYDTSWKPNIAPKVNLGWIRAIYRAQQEVRKNFIIAKPTLVMHSERSGTNRYDKEQAKSMDIILNVDDIERISCDMGSNVETVSISGGIHDLMLSEETVRQKVHDTIFDWLKRHNL